ncbi:glutamyl aminopeptidase-like isoform X2 [Homalodisca vitripennis]|uniref:glutamyl aminopeptidase-like isoform X2 n=1 Tax=Homalodisca vitripennis TaxID=197043 RepID=UPI001EEB8909|nr:glutamyl aminopeptidase-like isoform X2 [Homalodisca vitripennis]XP_046672951.1 glutamyl aminopeptidase-like isoform X2 [Homalodisca vitripennis]
MSRHSACLLVFQLLGLYILLTTATIKGNPWENEYRLSQHVLPELYNLLIYPNLDNGTFSGSVEITLNVTAPCDYITLHHKGLIIENSILSANQGSINLVKNAFDYPKNEFWVVRLTEMINPGTYSLKLDFSGSLTGDIVGFYRSTYKDISGESRNIATTKFEPTYARRAFPCFDEPGFKAKFNVSLVRPSSGNYIALSNMDQVSEVANSPGPGLTTVQFARSVPMSTYLVCFIVCDFDHLPPIKSKSGFDVSVYARRDQIRKMEYSQQIAVSSINYYIDYFGVPYSLPKLDLIAIPDFVSGAMENWGLITFRETSILYDPDFSSTSNHLGVTLTTNHELAHMWFGDLVTMKWWDDLWLNEGFATFMAAKASAHNHPDWDMDTVFLIEDLIDALALDSTLSSHPIVKHVSHPDQITEIFDRISYAKGASVIRMLEGFMGEENFREGVKAYLINFQFRNAETNDLWSCLQRYSTVDKNIPHVMDTWTRQMGYPVLTVTQAGDTITLTQQRFTADQNASYDPNESPYKYKWDVPVTHFTSDNKQSTLNWLLTEQPSLSIKIGNAQWYKLNWHFMGYYRVKYPLEHWTTLTNVLNNDIKAMDAADRANLMDDVFNLAESGHLDYSVALSLTTFLHHEDHMVVWTIAANNLLSIDTHLRLTPAYSNYRRYLRKLITPHFNDSLWSFPLDATFLQKSQQVRMIGLGCRVGVPTCLDKAKQLFTDWLQNNGPKPHVEIRNLVYYYGIAESGEDEWDKVWTLYLAESDPQEKVRLRTALCAVKEPWILARLIERAKNEDYVRSQDYFILLSSIANNPVGNGLLWDWVR